MSEPPAPTAPTAAPPARSRPRAIQLARDNSRLRVRAVGRRFAPHHDVYHYVLTRTWIEFFLLAGLAFLSANAFFAFFYWVSPGAVTNARPGSFEDAFFFSVQTMATIGYGGMTPATRFAHVVVTVEAMTGILSAALITGITFAKFARPTARVLFSDKMILAPRDGVPHLVFRIANWRHNIVAEAQLRVILLVTERTREGDSLRRQVELPLVRDRTPLFAFTWTVMHLVDAHSPFAGPDALARLRDAGADIYVTLIGLDEAMGQIHAQHSYRLDDIVSNVRFADTMTVRPDGTRVIDYRKFHELVPLAPEHLLPIDSSSSGHGSGSMTPP